MVGGDDARPVGGDVLPPDPRHPEVDVEERLEDRPDDPVDERVDALVARAVRRCRLRVHDLRVPRRSRLLQCAPMAIDRPAPLRGAARRRRRRRVWAAQQPLDQRLFGVEYDDTELLGKAVTRAARPGAPVGAAMHLANGALFGAVYANVAPRLPLPSWARGPAAALAEHVSSWPLVAGDRPRPPRPRRAADAWPARRRLRPGDLAPPPLRRRPRRARATPERRRRDESCPSYEHVVSTNGHGNINHAITGAAYTPAQRPCRGSSVGRATDL